MFAGLGMALAARLLPVRRVLGTIPPKVWLALAIALAALLGFLWHQHRAHQAINAAYQHGRADEAEHVRKQALGLKARIDSLTGKIAADERTKNDAENRRIAAAADALRLRGPGKAACARSAELPVGASGHVAPAALTDAAGPGLPQPDGAAVPWGWIVDRAEEHDALRAEVLSWREWYRRELAAWPKGSPASPPDAR